MSPQEHTAARNALACARQFFDLPLEKKLALRYRVRGVKVPGSGPGYRPMSEDPNFAKDLRESYNVGRDTAADTHPTHGCTPWPHPSDLPDFREASECYADLLLDKSKLLRGALAEALDTPATYFDAPGLFDKPTWLLGMVYYQPQVSRPSDGVYGIAPHQDCGMFTLLHTDGSSGLQICPSWTGSDTHRSADMHAATLPWDDVPHREGHWVVNLGTLLQRWSGGRFKATLHRVVTAPNLAAHRYSLPFFYEPNIDAEVTSLPSCPEGEDGTLTAATTPGDIHLSMWEESEQKQP